MSKQHSDAHARRQNVSRRQADKARAQLAAGGLTHQERRSLRSVTRARDALARRRHRAVRHLVIVAAGTIAAVALVAVATGLVSAIQAADGKGTVGTFIVGSQPCLNRRVGCPWPGMFRFRDGRTLQHVQFEGHIPADAPAGTSLPAIDPGRGSHIVYPPHGSHGWVADVLWMVLVGGIVGLLLWVSPLGLGRREASGAIV